VAVPVASNARSIHAGSKCRRMSANRSGFEYSPTHSSASSSVTFSIEDNRILIASARSQQEALSPQVFSINFDPLPAIRSALELDPFQVELIG
ncbi:MAG TPA: hypothetical protein VHG72_13295, partial [Polyangia bacterium]|nr:hypothetical protein [Polyangia bacterium]